MKLPRAAKLRRRRDFLRVQQRGKRLFAGDLVVLAFASGEASARVGITVSSRIGNAVVRNRVKRWVREAFRAERLAFPPVDVVVIARSGAKDLGLPAVRGILEKARARLGERSVPS